jgi:DNA-binding MarR family transcriptional regulator
MGVSENRSAEADSREILDALTGVVKQAAAISHTIAAGLGLAPADLLALFKLDEGVPEGTGVPMKELALRMGCDASFITVIADSLEGHGLLRREPGQQDRRVKNLVLTEQGKAAKERLMTELAGRMPWRACLDDAERSCFLALLRKMVAGTQGAASAQE